MRTGYALQFRATTCEEDRASKLFATALVGVVAFGAAYFGAICAERYICIPLGGTPAIAHDPKSLAGSNEDIGASQDQKQSVDLLLIQLKASAR